MTTRERFFECAFSSGAERRTAHVRAWTAAEARRAFVEMLASDGIDEPGRVDVTPVRAAARAPVIPAPARPRSA